MNLRQLEVFHAVMITGSTVAAAEMLHVTQPAISTTLKRMQDELGLALFIHSAGRLTPTPEARALFTQARAVQEDVQTIRRLARMLAMGKVGALRVGLVPALSEGVLAGALQRLRGDAPDLSISVDVLNSHELINRLLAGRLDFACVFGTDHGEPVQTRASLSVPLVAVGPSGNWPRATVRLADLAATMTAAMRPTDPIGRLLVARCEAEGVRLHPNIELRSSRGVVALAARGVASGIVDAITLGDFTHADIDWRPLDPPLSIELRIVQLAGRVLARSEERAINALVSEAQQRLKDVQPSL